MKNRRNYYRILHIDPDAHQDVIKSSYRTLMRKLKMQPDPGGHERHAELLNEAYAILSNPAKRADYDRQFQNRNAFKQGDGGKEKRHASIPEPPPVLSASCNKDDNTTCPFCGTEKPAEFGYGGLFFCVHCASPLQMLTGLSMVGKTKRTLQRLSNKAPMHFFTKLTEQSGHTAVIEDLSPRGLQFLSPEQLPENQVIKVVCDALSATARIRYCRPTEENGQYVIGAEFITLHLNDN